MNPVKNIMALEKEMIANGYWYIDSKKDMRIIAQTIADQGVIYVEAMDTGEEWLSIATKKGKPLCRIRKIGAGEVMKIVGIHPSGRSIIIEEKGCRYYFETALGSGREKTLNKAKFSAKFQSFTEAEKRRGMDVGVWKWRVV
ncbi:hypothetical protein [Listeria booriae]|uniref:hypothetical protein n=1 Tax=Listeria booriae TaxID=1552123 RepID=UPI00164D2293|nr:hypothetical protein [Listeria booriae]MBC6301610.1 hypothetical protein [Listeria booriae]